VRISMPLIAGAGLMVIVLATERLPVRVLPPVSSVAKALQAFWCGASGSL